MAILRGFSSRARDAFVGALLFGLMGASGPSDAAVARVFLFGAAPAVAQLSVELRARTDAHTIELRNFAAGADPVVYVLDPMRQQVTSAVAVDGRVVLSVSVAHSGSYTVIVRSRSAPVLQTGDLWVDGALATAYIGFSQGAAVALPQLAPDERVMAVAAPLGPDVHDAYLLSADGLTILAWTSGRHTSLSSTSTRDVLAVFATRVPLTVGGLRAYRNDIAHDTDGDGLGDELEAALGTCGSATGSVAGANCNEIADPRDTDGDGLQDGWEVLGIEASYPVGNATRHEYLPLPQWGADPRHKDIFIEVDFRRLNLAENQNNVVHKMSPAVARRMAGIYADVATTDFWLKAAHAVSVDNPDRKPGISLHLDTGVPPQISDDATIYGDWGGFNAVDATASGPQNPGQVWMDQMSPARRGVFHYVMGYTSGGGSCGGGIACGFNMNDAGNSAHEFGHTIGLDHNGPYTVQDEPNCKPNYPSLMNYAYLGSGYLQFSDGRNFPHFNNHSLLETNTVDPSNQPLLQALESYFRYKVDFATGSVDWNRDGLFAPANTPVRAYANYQPGGNCEFTREGAVPTGLRSEQSPAIVKVGGFLWVFALDRTGQVGYTRSKLPWTCATNNLDLCATPQFEPVQRRNIGVVVAIDAKSMVVNGREVIVMVAIAADGRLLETILDPTGGGASWGPVTVIPAGGAAGEPSLAAPSQKNALALAYRGRGGAVQVRGRNAQGWSPEQEVQVGGQPLTMYPRTSPALVYTGLPLGIAIGEHLMLAAADNNGILQFYTREFPLNHWGRIPIPYSTMVAKAGRPVMAWTGAQPGNTTLQMRRGLPTTPPLNYGRLYVIYLQYQEPAPIYHSPTNPPRMAMSYVGADGVLRIGIDAYFDNVWAFAYGLSVITPMDGALRVAMTSAVLPNHGTTPEDVVYFRPHADGIVDLTYYNYDDWKTLAHDSCTVLAATQATSPVHCAAPW